MTKLRTLLKKHALIAGGIAVLVPLLIIFYLQYRTLTTLGKTLPAYRVQVLNQYLEAVTEEMSEHYWKQSEQALGVSAKEIEFSKGGVIHDNKSRTASQRAVAKVAQHFKQQNFKGAKRYFIAVATEHEGEERSEVFFYDPECQGMVPDPRAPELVAINVACASYMVYIRAGTSISPNSIGIDRHPEHRLIVKPIYFHDEAEKEPARRIFAVAGMVLDWDYLMKQLLPETIRNTTPKFLHYEDQNALIALRYGPSNEKILALYDGLGNKLQTPTDNSESEPEAIKPLYFFFQRLHLSVRHKDLTVKQWARRNLYVSLSLWTLMALLLLTALALMLRTASREMRLTQMKADFVSNVSHELRTPLAAIRVLAELLNLGRVKDANKVREYGGYIEGEGRRLTQLINNILDFSRIESGKKSYNFERVDVKEVVDETLVSFSQPLIRNGFALEYKTPEGALPKIILDPDAIGLALTNLLDNAIKYSKSNKKISIQLELRNDFITITVNDQGIGIPREEQEKIFEKFYRGSQARGLNVEGVGIGLALVKHVAESHGGSVSVESRPGQGSRFRLRLPTA